MNDVASQARQWAAQSLASTGTVVRPDEIRTIEVTDFGLGRLHEVGLQVLVYVNTERVCSKEMVFSPWQICPEHRHPPQPNNPGKEETFRCRAGEAYLYVPGDPAESPLHRLPMNSEGGFSVWHEVVLRPGDQHTLPPNTLHWIQGGPEGAIVTEMSTHSADDLDIFTDERISAGARHE